MKTVKITFKHEKVFQDFKKEVLEGLDEELGRSPEIGSIKEEGDEITIHIEISEMPKNIM
jgi:hypothetical protein